MLPLLTNSSGSGCSPAAAAPATSSPWLIKLLFS